MLINEQALNKEKFKNLFDRYFDSVRNYLLYRGADTDLATDIAQDVFMKIWDKQMLIDIDKAAGLLYKIAGNMFISLYRRKKVEINYLKSIELVENVVSPEEQVQYEELRKKYLVALGKLTEKQRTVFLMSRMEGLKYQEIAKRLNISVKAVEKRMTVTLSILKNELQQQ